VTPQALAREAFHAAGEKRYPLARIAYPFLLGPDWPYALLGWGYIKTLDDIVDEEPSAQSSGGVLKAQRELIENSYAGVLRAKPNSRTEVYGEAFFRWDRERGAPLRASVETVLWTMEYDILRRGCVASREEIDAYIVKMGSALFDFLTHFAASGLALPEELREASSRAYLCADTLMDLEHDLSFGLVNIPMEDLEAYSIDPAAPDAAALHRWMADRVPGVEDRFDSAFALLRKLPFVKSSWGQLLLAQKRKKFKRFVADAGLG
jgi:hypothetical protein